MATSGPLVSGTKFRLHLVAFELCRGSYATNIDRPLAAGKTEIWQSSIQYGGTMGWRNDRPAVWWSNVYFDRFGIIRQPYFLFALPKQGQHQLTYLELLSYQRKEILCCQSVTFPIAIVLQKINSKLLLQIYWKNFVFRYYFFSACLTCDVFANFRLTSV